MKDRLSQLPNTILCFHILCKLDLEEAVRCSVLSRRWKSLWTQLPHLDCRGYSEEIINHILLLHTAPLESFLLELYLDEDNSCHPYKIWQWIRWTASKRVKTVALMEHLSCECELHPLEVPTSLFSCDSLRDLFLVDFKFTRVPSYFAGFKHLIKCSLQYTILDDYTVEQLVALCPRLEDLTLVCCRGLNSLKICAPNLRKLFLDLSKTQQLTVRCLQLTGFDLHLIEEERMDIIPNAFEIEIPICENLSLECIFLRHLPRMKQLSKIVLCNAQYVTCDSKWHEYSYQDRYFPGNVLPSLSLLKGFPNLEELCIDSACFGDLRTEEDMQGLSLEKLKKL